MSGSIEQVFICVVIVCMHYFHLSECCSSILRVPFLNITICFQQNCDQFKAAVVGGDLNAANKLLNVLKVRLYAFIIFRFLFLLQYILIVKERTTPCLTFFLEVM